MMMRNGKVKYLPARM